MIFEIEGSCTVHGEFHTKATGILYGQEPRVQIKGRRLTRRDSLFFGLDTMGFQFVNVALGMVVGNEIHANTGNKGYDRGNDGDISPSIFAGILRVLKTKLEKGK